MNTFDSLANEDWRIVVDEYDLNEPTICYPDPDHRGCFVGPLAMVPVGVTTEDDDGNDVLELDAADGRNLYAIACLPHFAELFGWIRAQAAALPESEFVNGLMARVDWIETTINERDVQMGVGVFGFERFRGS